MLRTSDFVDDVIVALLLFYFSFWLVPVIAIL